jgi:hypothetical protein
MDTASLRVHVYDRILGDGVVPRMAEVAEHFGVSQAEARDALRAARLGKTLIPHPATGEIWMAGPFSAAPTPYEVRVGDRSWWANCAWDMLGVAALAARPGGPAELDAACTDCGAPMPMRVEAGAAAVEGGDGAVVHFVVPARRWYDDIGFT